MQSGFSNDLGCGQRVFGPKNARGSPLSTQPRTSFARQRMLIEIVGGAVISPIGVSPLRYRQNSDGDFRIGIDGSTTEQVRSRPWIMSQNRKLR